jgi:hypothetical protein
MELYKNLNSGDYIKHKVTHHVYKIAKLDINDEEYIKVIDTVDGVSCGYIYISK